jgi:hypothetical protein
MKPYFYGVLLCVAIVIAPLHTACAQTSGHDLHQEMEEYERLGLSMEEWKMIQRSGMDMEQVYELLRAGISISEYFDKPWKELGVSKKEWITKRSQGYTNGQIAFRESRGTECDRQWDVVRAFFMPGIIQIKQKQHLKGIAMTSIAGLSIVASGSIIAYNVATDSDVPFLPFLVVVLPVDMAASSMDIILQHRKANQEKFKRFSFIATASPTEAGCGIAIRF